MYLLINALPDFALWLTNYATLKTQLKGVSPFYLLLFYSHLSSVINAKADEQIVNTGL